LFHAPASVALRRGKIICHQTARPVDSSRRSSAKTGAWRRRMPHFAFPPWAIIKRKPLSSTARRAGWIGCNFNLSRIPADARIPVVTTVAKRGTGILPVSVSKTDAAQGEHRLEACATLITPPEEVRARFKRVKPLGEIKAKERGWTLDVLNVVRRLSLTRPAGHPLPSDGRGTFTTTDVYAFERELEKLHPDNRN